MKPRPKSDDDDGGGLDSLLDTMTNVVGILVMVLIATQLGVKDAVSRIADSDIVDPAMVEAAREKLLLTKEQRDVVATQLSDLKPVDDSAIQVQLADLRRKLDETKTNLDQEKAIANQFALKIEEDTKKASEAKKKIEQMADADAKRDALNAELVKALDEEAKLKAMLDDTPVQEVPPPKVVTLPDPRPAPEGAREVTFLCANNRVYPIAADDWRDTIRKKAEFIVGARRLDGGPAVGVNEEAFMKEFKKANRRLTDDFFEVELYASGIYPRLKFIPKESEGATEEEVLKPRSRFQKMLFVLDKSKYYARFIVLPDSYEVYLAARAMSDQAGLLSGWDPQGEGWQYTTHLGGSILFGPKPPPDPNAKPAPPAKPANVID
ncbi:MAG: hypothetical protein H6822_32405 [Planctomycetaceae bacterium]|nr:hypothetical protein [Planctomycetales bacterium]MCB9926888.1 hypothetical protein [Planctomycetaceae bacterium]